MSPGLWAIVVFALALAASEVGWLWRLERARREAVAIGRESIALRDVPDGDWHRGLEAALHRRLAKLSREMIRLRRERPWRQL